MNRTVFRVGHILLVRSPVIEDAEVPIEVLPNVVSRGGTASVYKGRLNRPIAGSSEVALKVIQRPGDNGATREQIARELRALNRLRHRSIVPFLGSTELEDALVIVTPFMENGNLLAFLKRNPCSTRPLLVQVADAINYLHSEAGLVHGDLKCENVLVSDEGNALLADFGLSALVDKSEVEETTRTGFRTWGTLQFMAPELLVDQALSKSRRKRSKTPASDVYAFGMLVLQAFTGKHPWEGCTKPLIVLNVAHKATRVPHPRPDMRDPSGPSDLWWEICLACWEFDPGHRPSMEKVHHVLAATLSNEAGALILMEQLRVRRPLSLASTAFRVQYNFYRLHDY